MRVGHVVRTREIKALFWNPGVGAHGWSSFVTKKPEAFVLLLLGTARDDREFDAVKILKAMGWKPPKEVDDGRKTPAVAPKKRASRKAPKGPTPQRGRGPKRLRRREVRSHGVGEDRRAEKAKGAKKA